MKEPPGFEEEGGGGTRFVFFRKVFMVFVKHPDAVIKGFVTFYKIVTLMKVKSTLVSISALTSY